MAFCIGGWMNNVDDDTNTDTTSDTNTDTNSDTDSDTNTDTKKKHILKNTNNSPN